MSASREKKKLKVLPLTYVPEKVATKHLVDGCFLHTKEDRQRLLEFLKKNYKGNPAKISKKYLKNARLPDAYSIISYEGQYYALYIGRKSDRHAGAGSFGVVKYMQNLRTGEFDQVAKIYSEHHRAPGARFSYSRDDIILKEAETKESSQLVLVGAASSGDAIIRQSNGGKGLQRIKPQQAKKGLTFDEMIKDFLSSHRSAMLESPQYILQILINMCTAVSRLHEINKLIHRDIKKENFIVNPDTAEVELIDFGFSIPLNHTSAESEKRVGTLYTVAPEIICRVKPIYGEKSDAFALGATIASGLDITKTVLDDVYEPTTLAAKSDRIKQDPVLSGIYDMCELLMRENPDDRIDIKTAITKLKELQAVCKDTMQLLAFNIADYVNSRDKHDAIEYLVQHHPHEIVLLINEEDQNDPALMRAALSFRRKAHREGMIVHTQALLVPEHMNKKEVLEQVKSYFAEVQPHSKRECEFVHYIPRRHRKYFDALCHVLAIIPNTKQKNRYLEMLAEMSQCGASVAKMIERLKQLLPAKPAAGSNSGLHRLFQKPDARTEEILDVIRNIDLNIKFKDSELVLLHFNLFGQLRNAFTK